MGLNDGNKLLPSATSREKSGPSRAQVIEMHKADEETLSGDDPLDAILAAYLQAAETGTPPDRQAFIAEHVQFRKELEEFFTSQRHFELAIQPFRITARSRSSSAGLLQDGDDAARNESGLTVRETGDRPHIFGQYELLEELGRGGMGVVYRARQTQLDRTVALKMILTGQFAASEEIKRFQVEAQNAARLDHPNIVPIYEVGQFKGQHFFTMKLIEGGTLTDQKYRFPKDPKAAVRLVSTVAQAVHYAHQRGILHRDLKPGNILLDKEGSPQVTDFGLAQRLEGDGGGLTISGAVLGSPRYMAPEQARGSKVLTIAADVWGLGAILYELLTGRPPFVGDSILDTLSQVKDREPVRPSSGAIRVDRDLETICLKCLEKDPKRRYPSAQDLSDEMERWQRGEPIAARSIGRTERAWRWCIRNPSLAGLAASGIIAAILLIVLGVGVAYQARLQSALDSERHALTDLQNQKRLTEAALRQSQTYAYLARIAWAEREYQGNDVARAEQILDECPPELRNWEWQHLKRLCHAEIASVASSSGAAITIPGPGGAGLLTLGSDGILRSWGSKGEALERNFPPLKGATSVAIKGDGQVLLAGFADGAVRTWQLQPDAKWRKQLLLLEPRPAPADSRFKDTRPHRAAVLSSDGRFAVVGDDAGSINVWDTATGEIKLVLNGHSGQINGLTFSIDGQWLVSCSGDPSTKNSQGKSTGERGGEIKVWDMQTGRLAHELGSGAGAVYAVRFLSPSRLASAHGDGTIKIWDAFAGRLEATLRGHSSAVLAISPSFDGEKLVSAGADQSVRVWSISTGEQLAIYRGHNTAVQGAFFLPDDQRLVSAALDGARIWDATAGPEARVLIFKASDVAFRQDSARIAASGAATILWDLAGNRQQWRTETARPERGPRIAFNAKGTQLAVSAAGGVVILDAGTGQTVVAMDSSGDMTPLAFSPDGSMVAAARMRSQLGTIKLWSSENGKLLQTLTVPKMKGRHCIFDLMFRPDGKAISAVGGSFSESSTLKEGGDVWEWDVATGAIIRNYTESAFCCWAVAYSPDGKWLAAGGGAWGGQAQRNKYQGPGGDLRVWEVASGRQVFVAKPREAVFRIRFSPDSSRMAWGGGQGQPPATNDVTLVDTSVWREVLHLHGHKDQIEGLAFSSDGRMLASASLDGTVRIWNTPPVRAGTWYATTQPSMQPSSQRASAASSKVPIVR